MAGLPDRPTDHGLDCLCVDQFLTGLVEASVLRASLDVGMVDVLVGDPDGKTLDEIHRAVGRGGPTPEGLIAFGDVLAALAAQGIVEDQAGRYRLTDRFRVALEYRDLLEAKLEMGFLAAADLVNLGTTLVTDYRSFADQSKTFAFFAYEAARATDSVSLRHARAWVRYLTELTRYEAPLILDRYPIEDHSLLLDIGGNSGEFALQACQRSAGLRAVVFDLPAVASIATERIGAAGLSSRITAIGGDAKVDALPGGADLVVMKSFLHDWADGDADLLIRKAHQVLEPGGTMVIVERASFNRWTAPLPFSAWAMLLFASALPGPARYEATLRALDYRHIEVEAFDVDTPWFILRARRNP